MQQSSCTFHRLKYHNKKIQKRSTSNILSNAATMAHIFKQPDFKDTIKEFEQVSDELFQFRVIGQTGLDENGIGLIALF